ncbi:hypothetical protein [Mycolicibacterium baixiangningiae]|uniref:hypothetical protein n=1 Tax=Mycolicibacterium baixiangningiae TaxID=2761578 RepID=UPI001D0120EB|nr:hypothetical protein [Mycolicibacterium baixiangningiae]
MAYDSVGPDTSKNLAAPAVLPVSALAVAPGEHLFEDGEVESVGGVGVDLAHEGGRPGVEVGVDGVRAAPGDGAFDLAARSAGLFGEFVDDLGCLLEVVDLQERMPDIGVACDGGQCALGAGSSDQNRDLARVTSFGRTATPPPPSMIWSRPPGLVAAACTGLSGTSTPCT